MQIEVEQAPYRPIKIILDTEDEAIIILRLLAHGDLIERIKNNPILKEKCHAMFAKFALYYQESNA